MKFFYDTNALLNIQEKVLTDKFYISLITLRELENIKISSNKDNEIKYKARKVIHMLHDTKWGYEVVIAPTDDSPNMNNDSKIIEAVKYIQKKEKIDVIFVTDDLSCCALAEAVGIQTRSTGALSDEESYLGFRELSLSEEELCDFYADKNKFIKNFAPEILNNEYIFITAEDEVVDAYRKTEEDIVKITYPIFESDVFGKVKPKDVYQQIAMDSMVHNQITIVRGPAGSGKSWLCMSYLFHLLEKGKIDKIIIFCNTVAVKNAAKLGFYPGTKEDKLLDSQIGNFLASKVGSRFAVEKMIEDETLVLVPVADARGYDTTGMNAGVYIQEAQNLDKDLMKLLLQRLGEDTICLIDGDELGQVDLDAYAGMNNGMRRAIEVFKGQDFFGTVQLQKIRRSKIAEVADEI